MSLEVSSIGLLSKFFSNLNNDLCKQKITLNFGIKDIDILENWMLCFSLLRNICAHHGRVWNRRMTQITLLRKPNNIYIENKNLRPYKIYGYIVQMHYILNIISPQHDFKSRLIQLIQHCPLAQEKEMGFPDGWQNEIFWQ